MANHGTIAVVYIQKVQLKTTIWFHNTNY
jgi:hypothetical protein